MLCLHAAQSQCYKEVRWGAQCSPQAWSPFLGLLRGELVWDRHFCKEAGWAEAGREGDWACWICHLLPASSSLGCLTCPPAVHTCPQRPSGLQRLPDPWCLSTWLNLVSQRHPFYFQHPWLSPRHLLTERGLMWGLSICSGPESHRNAFKMKSNQTTLCYGLNVSLSNPCVVT